MSCDDCDADEVYLDNDHVIDLDEINVSDVNLNSATVEFQIYDSEEEEVVGASGTITPVGTGGDYTATIDKAIINLLTKGEEYTIRINGVESGNDFEFNIPIIVKRRGKT